MISAIVTAFVSFASTNIDDIFVLMVFFSQIGGQMKKRHIIIGQYLGIATLLFVSILGSVGLNLIPQKYTGLLGIVPILLGIKEWLKYRKEKKTAVNSINESVSNVQSETVPDVMEDTPIIVNPDKEVVKTGKMIETEAKKLTAEGENYISESSIATNLNNDIKQAQALKKGKIKAVLTKLIHPAVLNVSLVTIANGADNIGVYIPLFMKLTIPELIMTIVIFILLIAVWCFIGERLTNLPGIKYSIQKYKNIIVPVVFILIGAFILVESDFVILLFEKFTMLL